MTGSLLAGYIGYSIPFIMVSWALLKWKKSYTTSTNLTIKSVLWGVGLAMVVNYTSNIDKANTANNMTDRHVKEMNKLWEPLAGTKLDDVTVIQSLYGVKMHDKFTVLYNATLEGVIDDYDPERMDLMIENLDQCAKLSPLVFKFDNIKEVEIVSKYTSIEDLKIHSKKVICKR